MFKFRPEHRSPDDDLNNQENSQQEQHKNLDSQIPNFLTELEIKPTKEYFYVSEIKKIPECWIGENIYIETNDTLIDRDIINKVSRSFQGKLTLVTCSYKDIGGKGLVKYDDFIAAVKKNRPELKLCPTSVGPALILSEDFRKMEWPANGLAIASDRIRDSYGYPRIISLYKSMPRIHITTQKVSISPKYGYADYFPEDRKFIFSYQED